MHRIIDKTEFSIQWAFAEIRIHLSTDLVRLAEKLRDHMLANLDPSIQLSNVELLFKFIETAHLNAHCCDSSLRITSECFTILTQAHLRHQDPHLHLPKAIKNIPISSALNLYYRVCQSLQRANLTSKQDSPSALLQQASNGTARLLCLFGGQGNTDDLLKELVELDTTYHPICRPFMQAVTRGLDGIKCEQFEASMTGTDFLQWLDNAESRPIKEHVLNTAISMPLIGLIQLTNVYINYHILGLSFQEYQEKFSEVTGHSQGIISAAVFSASTSEESFVTNANIALKVLKIMGDVCMRVFPPEPLSPRLLTESTESDEGMATSMLAIHLLSLQKVQNYVDMANNTLSETERIQVALLNGPFSCVCAGPCNSLYGLAELLRHDFSSEHLDQAKIPFTERKRRISMRFLPIKVPFHSLYLTEAVALIVGKCKAQGLAFESEHLMVPLRAQDTGKISLYNRKFTLVGERMEYLSNDGFLHDLVEQICVRRVDWRSTIEKSNSTHILDHGPGNESGVGALTSRQVQGRGIQIVLAGTLFTTSHVLSARDVLFQNDPLLLPVAENWETKFKPRLLCNNASGKIHVDTKFSRLIGKQPIMVAGMTPTTVDGDFVSAVINAGYHVELAGGGHYHEKMLREKIELILKKIEAGNTISLNVLFINQRQWGFQFPLVQAMRREGLPIEGFTVAAGVPSLEAANEIIESLQNVGIKHVSFKPSSVESILNVVNVAKTNPGFPIILQWTGGRAGGHHSYEDFHEPILQTYSTIRSVENICLVAGSGFGDGEGTFPYLTGAWSTKLGYPAMPFDGILFGSRMMVAKECKASRSVKELICQTTGVSEEEDWVKSYKESVGGVVTVISELGEPIHKIATRAVLLWKEFDETLFKLPKSEMLLQLRERRQYIIDRLNKDSHRVWFGKDSKGESVDIDEMTYGEILGRLIELLFVQKSQRWIDQSYATLFVTIVSRFHERLMQKHENLEVWANLKNPIDLVRNLISADPRFNVCITAEDAKYLIELFCRPSQKPVPFVPILDETFQTWFKKDSLWQSEDVDSVHDADPQRTCILQGPVAVKYCQKVDEPVKEILDNITDYYIKRLLEQSYGSDVESIPREEYFGMNSPELSMSSRAIPGEQLHVIRSKYDLNGWLDQLIGGRNGWLSAMLVNNDIFQGQYFRRNAIRDIFCSDFVSSATIEATLLGTVRLFDLKARKLLEMIFDGGLINATLYDYDQERHNELRLYFAYCPTTPAALIQEVGKDRIHRIRQFYWNVWFGESSSAEFMNLVQLDSRKAIFRTTVRVSQADVARFCQVVGNQNHYYSKTGTVPLDYSIVIAWQPVIKCLFTKNADGDLLQLVHLSNSFTVLVPQKPIRFDNVVEVEARISAIRWTPSGKVIIVSARLSVDKVAIIDCTGEFMYRGRFERADLYYERQDSVTYLMNVETSDTLWVLRDKPWIKWASWVEFSTWETWKTLKFRLEYYHRLDVNQDVIVDLECRGIIEQEVSPDRWNEIGKLELSSVTPLFKNPVLDFLDRNGKSERNVHIFDIPRPMEEFHFDDIQCLVSNEFYSSVSGDTNPIHTNKAISTLAGLPGCIVHGMWTSAAVRSGIERAVCLRWPERVKRYKVLFDSMVLPSDVLSVQLQHKGMDTGLMLCSFKVFNKANSVVVMTGEIDVELSKSAFLFTGQGSQQVGMGMDLYATSPAARAVWETAEKHFKKTYGISILAIIRENPRSLTVYFGGHDGLRIRANYQSLVHEVCQADGSTSKRPLFPSITDETWSYTFSCPNGLLFATQFTQPALTLMEKAAFEDIKSKGLVGRDICFAGHSLGEYAALASVANVIPVETLCDIVFYRGLSMQVAVERDSNGNSEFGMIAVNPQRARLKVHLLNEIVQLIAQRTGKLLEIVNHNVENWQYVTAGHLVALNILTNVTDEISKMDMDGINVSQMIDKHVAATSPLHFTELKRGVATIPLAGIDVPFHSSFLTNGVASFRRALQSRIALDSIDPEHLNGKYIPNLVGVPFQVSLKFIEKSLEYCQSPILIELSRNWNDVINKTDQRHIARIILIELLAYQFASSVLWIATQNIIFANESIDRVIEIGPTPTLCTMAERTLSLQFRKHDMILGIQRKVLHIERDKSSIFFETLIPDVEPSFPVSLVAGKSSEESSPEPLYVKDVLTIPTAIYHELPVTSIDVLHAIVSIKLKKPINDVPLTKSIKELSSGKSTLQNEILADLHKEFGDTIPDRAEDASLQDLGTQLSPHFSKNPGPLTSGMISKLFAAKMPPGFTIASARSLLEREFGLQGKSGDQLMLASLHLDPVGRLANEDAAAEWLRLAVLSFFKSHQIPLPAKSSKSGNQPSPMISSAELKKLEQKQQKLAWKQMEVLIEYLNTNNKVDSQEYQRQVSELRTTIDILSAELGEKLCAGVTSQFSVLRARHYNSAWNWRRQRVYTWAQNLKSLNDWSLTVEGDKDLLPLFSALQCDTIRSIFSYELQRDKRGADVLETILGILNMSNLALSRFDSILTITRPELVISNNGDIKFCESERPGVQNLTQYVHEVTHHHESGSPHIFICENTEQPIRWHYSPLKTEQYFKVLCGMAESGLSFHGRKALVTGCGNGSIGCEIVKGLLLGGAKVIATTSSYNRKTIGLFRRLYEECCIEGSELVLVPFNQASVQDIESLVNYIYKEDPKAGLGWDLDYVIPFAAVPEKGKDLSELDDDSELAHRLMLTSVLRIMSCVIKSKQLRGIKSHPAQVVLPLSPNHGVFGGDGLYGESKLGLETLFNRWHSESWGDQLSIVGVSIGWTRGTGLMNDNNILAEGIERLGLRTFSPGEMAFNILGLLHPTIGRLADDSPIYANLNGGLDCLSNLSNVTRELRATMEKESYTKRLLWNERQLESSLDVKSPLPSLKIGNPRSRLEFSYPTLPTHDDLPGAASLSLLLDLSQIIVITGFAETGPWGNSRTRWEMEAFGEFSLEGCIEMAWIMGMIIFKSNGEYTGWVDAKTGAPVYDHEIKAKYESDILKHAGVRLVEPELFGGYDPEKKVICRELVIEYDMAPFDASKEEAEHFKHLHNERAEISCESDGGWKVKLKKGATLYIPKALRFDRLVAGQIPTGWNAERYGVPRDIVEQVDPVTLFALVSTVEALVSSGITDPYEFYNYVHVSEVGNTAGGGEGGMLSNRKIFLHRFLDKPVQADILQESFINTMPAWINLLLLGSSGPIKTPVGACGTAVQSVDIGAETILSGKAKIVIVGGYDDLQEESAYEFASMQATSNARDELARGREPHEMSRPAASTRSGFMESQGAGIQILMSAELALQMGCPIYGIVALSNTAMDKIGRSVPAPGRGILTTAKSIRSSLHKPRILDLEYRQAQLMKSLSGIKILMNEELSCLHDSMESTPQDQRESTLEARLTDMEEEFDRRESNEKKFWGSEFWKRDARISPLEGALSVFGLTVDDINVGSFHGTGTKANDTNEANVVNMQLRHLGRHPANLLPCIFQKHLTGHPKGAAAAWMLNGIMQVMATGIVPGNRNADNIDEKLRDCEFLLFPSQKINVGHVKAALIKSFGFGQVGGEVLMVNPLYLYKALPKHQYDDYVSRRHGRYLKTYRYMHNVLVGNHKLVQVKESPPYTAELESAVYLNPLARASRNLKTGNWGFSGKALPREMSPGALSSLMARLGNWDGSASGAGVDVQLIADLPWNNGTFLEHNFTAAEIEYTFSRPDPRASLAGRWAAKEAIYKALCEAGQRIERPAGSLKMIEIESDETGVPIARISGVTSAVRVSISHSGEYAIALAIVNK